MVDSKYETPELDADCDLDDQGTMANSTSDSDQHGGGQLEWEITTPKNGKQIRRQPLV
jgi:hypothetical protein